MSPAARAEDRCGGFTVVEMLVVLVLLSIIVLAASTLVVESIRLLDASGRSLQDPAFSTTAATLRQDVHAASAVSGLAPLWSADPLDLIMHNGETVRISSEAGRLVRLELSPTGRELGRRTLVGRVRSWQWRSLSTRLVEIQVTLLRFQDPWDAARTWQPGQPSSPFESTDTLVLAVRGGDWGREW